MLDFNTPEIGAHTDWYPSLMHLGTANTVLEFHGLEYQWTWFCTLGANTNWYLSLMDYGTANTVLEFYGLGYQLSWFYSQEVGANTDWYPSLVDSSTALYDTRAQKTGVRSGIF